MQSMKDMAAEVLRRAQPARDTQAMRRRIAWVSLAGLACLAVIVAVALSMPGLYSAVPGQAVLSAGLGSLFLQNEGLGYVVVGVLAFILGVLVSLLAFLLKKKSSPG